MKHTIALLFLLSLCFIRKSIAQQTFYSLDTTTSYTVRVVSGNSFTGKVIKEYNDSIQMKNDDFNNIVIQKKYIISIKSKPRIFPFPNPNPHQYFLLPSAVPLKKGSLSYRNYYIIGHYINYGITNNISVGIGGFVLPGINHPITYLFTISPKIEFPVSKRWYVGGGIVYFTHNVSQQISGDVGSLGNNYIHDGGAYINVTYGTPNNNISLIYSYSTLNQYTLLNIGNELEENFNKTIKIGGMVRVHKNISLISESWLFFNYHNSNIIIPIPAFGARFFGKKIIF